MRNTLPVVSLFSGAGGLQGAGGLISDPNKSQVVAPFLEHMKQIVEHYHMAIIISAGASKVRAKDQYTLKRDRLFGSQMWSRMTDDVLIVSHVGDGTEDDRDLDFFHRNAKTESFHPA